MKTLILCKTCDLIAGRRIAVKNYSADWIALEVSVNTRSHSSSQSSGPDFDRFFFFVSETFFFLVFANGKSQVAMSSRRSGALRRSLLSSCLDGLATKTIPESPGLANLPRCLKMSFDIQISIFLRILLSACFSRQRLQARATEQSRTNFMYVCPFFFGCFDVF